MRRTALILPFMLLAWSCAQVADITGGDQDTRPPQLIGAQPPMGTTRFAGNRIVLQFDERIELDRGRDRMLVSPPLTAPPNVRLTGPRELTIDLKAPLAANVTYSFGIGEAVKDLTEGNVAAGLVYVVSTGETLDSLTLEGVVTDAFSGGPAKDVLLLLHTAADTAAPLSTRPAYATRSDGQGLFQFRYLAEGSYRLYGLRDLNANYRYDLPNEEVAFHDGPLVLTAIDSLLSAFHLHLFMEAGRAQALRESKVTPHGALRMVLALPAIELALQDIARTGGALTWTPEWSSGRDTVLMWPSDTTALGVGSFEVRCDGTRLDTVRYRRIDRMPYQNSLGAAVDDQGARASIVVRSARPIRSFDARHFTLRGDSIDLSLAVQRDTADTRTLRIMADLEPGNSAVLSILPNGVNDIYGGTNDTLRIGLGRAADRMTGILRVRIGRQVDLGPPWILQLVDGQGRAVREQVVRANDGMVAWERLSPGSYGLRALVDANDNGRWDTGRLREGVQPERILRHPEVVNVRAAWDLTIDWVVQ